MPRATAIIPAESSRLCEGCGYILDGLPEDGQCPECGKPVIESADADGRTWPAWEATPGLGGFLTTTAAVMLHPRNFYRTLRTRDPLLLSNHFARLHWMLTSLFMGTAAFLYWMWMSGHDYLGVFHSWHIAIWPGLMGCCYLLLSWVTALAAKLSSWEAGFRGWRMPYKAVLRALHYHSPHYLPVGLIALSTIIGFLIYLPHARRPDIAIEIYMYTLCAEVVLGAAYLFRSYWAAMTQIMYANR